MHTVLGLVEDDAVLAFEYVLCDLDTVQAELLINVAAGLGLQIVIRRQAVQNLDFSVLLPSSAMGFLSNAVLNINNMRDYENDKVSGKNSLVVKLGLKNAFIYHCLLIGGAFICLTLFLALHHAAWYSYLFLLVSLLFVKDVIAIKKTKPEHLDPFLGRQVKHSFLLVLTFGILLLI